MRLHQWLFSIPLFIFSMSLIGTAWAEPIAGPNLAQDVSDLKRMMAAMESNVEVLKSTVRAQNEIIERQNYRIETFEKKQISLPSSAVAAPQTPASAKTFLQGKFNPDIGVVGTTQAKLTQNKADVDGNNTIALKELEVNFSGVVDPYSRLDAVLALNDNLESQNVDIEEAYYTRWGLPFGFTTQLGKFRADIGKENLLHSHQLQTVDYPLVIRDFFGEEGLSSSGARLKNSIPNPWDLPLEITGEVLRGNNGNSFSGISRRPIFNTHLKTFFEPSQDTNMELGWTTMFGDENPSRTIMVDDGTGTGTLVATSYTPPEGQDRYGVKIFGGDATFNWFLPEGKKVMCQNELYFQNRGNVAQINNDPWGFYSLLDYKFSEKFSTGVRFDYLNPLDVGGGHGTTSVSPYFIFWQSEFADAKLQYSHTVSAGGEKTDNAAFFVVDFMIGAHKHAVQ